MTRSPDPAPIGAALAPAQGARVQVAGHERRQLDGWRAAAASPDSATGSGDLDSLRWLPARVPGTAAGALRDAGEWRPGEPRNFDGEDWWFRTTFSAAAPGAGEEVVLRLDGIATVGEVYLNGRLMLESESMFASHCLDIGDLLEGDNELAIRCRALDPLLEVSRRPRARWRTRLVRNGNLRFFRTMLLGRAPGFAPGPAAVGPWRGVWLERRSDVVVHELELRPRVSATPGAPAARNGRGSPGTLAVRGRLRALGDFAIEAAELELAGSADARRAALQLSVEGDTVVVAGELSADDVARWWPHTHGVPTLYGVRLLLSGRGEVIVVDAGRVGFRTLAGGRTDHHDLEREGLALHVNGEPIFARGAVWTPADFVGLNPTRNELAAALAQVRDAGMNLLRIPGTGAYESHAFYELCDELGILVWQDMMFANLDYPTADEAFRATVEREALTVLAGLAAHPSVAVVCGNSEIEQQVAMLGLDPALGRGELFGELLPGLCEAIGPDAVYVPSAPCGGERPFAPDRGVANYFGVGGYRRPLSDARLAQVHFASECLAFSNVPDAEAIAAMSPETAGDLAVHDPLWKAGVPRDAGSGWDFEDVRDHYMQSVFGVDPQELRRIDHDRYLDLSRIVTGEVMAEVLGEWRRSGSPCGGAIVLWLRDLLPGAGWGLVDHLGEPKAAYHHVRRVLAPVAVWMTDEGLAGVRVHLANDGPAPLNCRLRVALYRDFEQRVGEAREALELPARSFAERDVERLLGHFVDASFAYRFGPPAQDLIVASLEGPGAESGSGPLLSQALRFPAGRPLAREAPDRLGLWARVREAEEGGLQVELGTRRFAYAVRVHAPGFRAAEDAFSIEPGAQRSVALYPRAPGTAFDGCWLTAINMVGRTGATFEQRPGGDGAASRPADTHSHAPSRRRARDGARSEPASGGVR
jgi:beta-mannosidase